MKELIKDIHENAKAHGWHDYVRTFGEIIALINSKLYEALEEYRKGHKETEIYFNAKEDYVKPEGIPVELADVIIRIFDYCEHAGIDIEHAIRLKHEYNKTRPYRHGGKTL